MDNEQERKRMKLLYYIKSLPRKLGLKIFKQYEFLEMLNTNVNCVGFISKDGKAILYGSHYRKLWFWGLVR